MTGDSYFGNLAVANLNENRAPCEAPADFELTGIPLNTEANETEFPFTLVLPTRRTGTLEDAESDDVYNLGAAFAADVVGPHGIGNVEVYTATDHLAALDIVAGNRIAFGTGILAPRYVVAAVYADRLALTYGLVAPLLGGEDLNRLQRVAEAPPTARAFRIDTVAGKSITIRREPGDDTIDYWAVVTTLGAGEDRNKILATINEATRVFSKKIRREGGVPVVLAAPVPEGATNLPLSCTTGGILFTAGDLVTLAEDSENYLEVATVYGSSLDLVSPTTESYAAGALVYVKEPTSTVNYTADPILAFSARWPFSFATEASALNLYYSEVPQAPGALGIKVALPITYAGLAIGAPGAASALTYTAAGAFFRGRKLYWAASVTDAGISQNESAADINVWGVAEPGQPEGGTIDYTDPSAIIIGYAPITTGGNNPSLYDAMGGAGMTQYSEDGGYDVFARAVTQLTLTGGGGYYRSLSATAGRIVHSAIQAGDFVRIVNGVTRNLWVARATLGGQVDFSATSLRAGTNPADYGTLAQINFSVGRAAVNVATDSIVPPAPGPVKQYLTDAVNALTYTGAEITSDYIFVMAAVDTTCDFGKL